MNRTDDSCWVRCWFLLPHADAFDRRLRGAEGAFVHEADGPTLMLLQCAMENKCIDLNKTAMTEASYRSGTPVPAAFVNWEWTEPRRVPWQPEISDGEGL